MDCYPCALALIGIKVVGGCAIFMETRKSGLDLPGLGSKFFVKEIIMMIVI